MSIFANMYGATKEVDVNPAYFPENGGAASIITESAVELSAVMESVHALDVTNTMVKHSVIENTGVVEAAGENFFDKIKKFFKKVWERITSFFKGMLRQFDALFKDGEEIIKKYGKDISSKDLSNFKMTVVEYKLSELNTITIGGLEHTNDLLTVSGLDSIIEVMDEDDFNEKQRAFAHGAVLGKTSGLDDDEFKEELAKLGYRGDGYEDSKVEDTQVSFNTVKSSIDEIKNIAKEIEKASKKANQSLSKTQNQIAKLQKAYINGSLKNEKYSVNHPDDADTSKTKSVDVTPKGSEKYVAALRQLTRSVSHMQSSVVLAYSHANKVIREASSQNTRILRKMLTYKPAKK